MTTLPLPNTLMGLAKALKNGDVTTLTLVQLCFEKIDNPEGEGARVFISTNRDGSLVAAEAMDLLRAANMHPTPFAGIPLAIKDIFDIRGEVTTAGS